MDNGLVPTVIKDIIAVRHAVLILVVVDNGLVHFTISGFVVKDAEVLILVVVDNGLVHEFDAFVTPNDELS